jgi:serine/threonine protein kinase/tetratricopeptide (TPR) repeat protein
MSLAPGTRVGPYEIVGWIGAGGMGEVFRAKDTKLGREVAIKMLPEGFGSDADRLKRFRQEARTLSALNHPNVLTIHDLGEHEGAPFLVTELLEGETLRQKLGGKPLGARKAAEIALQVAKGLAAAHEKGILHRDLKPENLFLTWDGRVKILDFGLAKLQEPAIGSESETRTNLSDPGRVVGTVGYMSPEQVQGLPLDARSDLFSLGVVLWEMLTGKAPFHRTSALETQHAILKEDPPDPDETLKVPTVLMKILDTCLAKDPAARFHSAHDLAFGLESLSLLSVSDDPATEAVPLPRRRLIPGLIAAAALLLAAAAGFVTWKSWRPAAPPYEPRSVAILPFENRTGDPSLEPLGQRIVDLLRQDLQSVDDLKVAADQPLTGSGGSPMRRLAEATKARFVASGSFYAMGRNLEFQARLEDPWTGQVIYQLGPWKAPREDPDQALPELRQRVAGAVAWTYDQLLRYAPGAVRPPRLEALQAYRQVMMEFTATSTNYQIPGFERAVALDPDFFPLRLDFYDIWMGPSLMRRDKAAEQVIAMEARQGSLTPVERTLIRMTRAMLEGWRSDMVKSCEDLNALMPGYPWVELRMAQNYIAVGRLGSAIPILRAIPADWAGNNAAMAPDPSYWLCTAYHAQGNYAAELQTARETQVRFPGILTPRIFEAEALVGLGRVEEAERLVEAVSTTPPGRGGARRPEGVRFRAAMELRAHGHGEQARRMAEEWQKTMLAASPEQRKATREQWAETCLCMDQVGAAVEVYQELAREFPDHIGHLGRYGATLARLGRIQEARAVDSDLAGLTRPYLRGDPTFWRACIAANLGEKEHAVDLLRRAFAQGRAPIWPGATDRGILLESLRGFPPYEDLMKPKD